MAFWCQFLMSVTLIYFCGLTLTYLCCVGVVVGVWSGSVWPGGGEVVACSSWAGQWPQQCQSQTHSGAILHHARVLRHIQCKINVADQGRMQGGSGGSGELPIQINWQASEVSETLSGYQFEICDTNMYIRECASTLYLGLTTPFPLV